MALGTGGISKSSFWTQMLASSLLTAPSTKWIPMR